MALFYFIASNLIYINELELHKKHEPEFLGKRMRWSTPEKEVLRSSAEKHSLEGTSPTLPECELLFEKNKSILKSRNPSSIKSFLYNKIHKQRNENMC